MFVLDLTCKLFLNPLMRKVIKDNSPEKIKLLSENDLEKPVTSEDFNEALESTFWTVEPENADKHEQWIKQYGSH